MLLQSIVNIIYIKMYAAFNGNAIVYENIQRARRQLQRLAYAK